MKPKCPSFFRKTTVAHRGLPSGKVHRRLKELNPRASHSHATHYLIHLSTAGRWLYFAICLRPLWITFVSLSCIFISIFTSYVLFTLVSLWFFKRTMFLFTRWSPYRTRYDFCHSWYHLSICPEFSRSVPVVESCLLQKSTTPIKKIVSHLHTLVLQSLT